MGPATARSRSLETQVVQHVAFMWSSLHWAAMRIVPFAGILVLLHDLVVLGLFLGALFRSQQSVDIPSGFDGGHTLADLQVAALL